MEGLTEIPEKLTRAEFDQLYNRALSRLREREKRRIPKNKKTLDSETIRPYSKKV